MVITIEIPVLQDSRDTHKRYYYHFVGHCGAFCGLKWRIWRAKNENQIIVRSKQPIKIEKPFQSLLTFSHSAGEKNILQSVLLSFFSLFIFSMPSKVILILIVLRLIESSMSLTRAKNIFMPKNINSIVILFFNDFGSLPNIASLNISFVVPMTEEDLM